MNLDFFSSLMPTAGSRRSAGSGRFREDYAG